MNTINTRSSGTIETPSIYEEIFGTGGMPDTVIEDAPPVIQREDAPAPAKPPLYAIILQNDNTTNPTFVIRVLREAFGVEGERAAQVMMAAHRGGRALVQVVTKDIADSKLGQAMAIIATAQSGRDFYSMVRSCELLFTVELETKGD